MEAVKLTSASIRCLLFRTLVHAVCSTVAVEFAEGEVPKFCEDQRPPCHIAHSQLNDVEVVAGLDVREKLHSKR